MILVVDNYDSFTFNIVQYLGEMGQEIVVRRNDAVTIEEIASLRPDHLLISPGPCSPAEAGVSVEAIRRFAGEIPIFGVCLGHQSIGHAFGGRIVRAGRLMHGKTSRIRHDAKGVFAGMPQEFAATRYHSLVIEKSSLPDCLEATAWSVDDGEIQGVRHKTLPVEGVQFHPESVLTEGGKRILANFVGAPLPG